MVEEIPGSILATYEFNSFRIAKPTFLSFFSLKLFFLLVALFFITSLFFF
jgi:hypothetical protein